MAIGDGVRRNVATVSREERDRLRNAFIELNRRFYLGSREDVPLAGGVSYWFKQDEIHQATHVHGGPAFLTWHRELCNRLEALLREVDPGLSLHYWDWNTDPRRSPDGRDKTVNLFTKDFMGSASGQAGEPWLSAKFYDPKAKPGRPDIPNSGNPADPPLSLEREVAKGAPPVGKAGWPAEAEILDAETYPEMRARLESAHDGAHGYIGGNLADGHISFRDPFVFLLHSNVDRLFALWQLQPGKEWRLDPERVYGSESDSFSTVHREVGILNLLGPWAGWEGLRFPPGEHPARPWAPPENEHTRPENQKDSKHPSVVAPPLYDTSPPRSLRELFTKRSIDPRLGVRALAPGAGVVSLRALLGS